MPEKAAMDRRRMSGSFFLFFLYLLCMLLTIFRLFSSKKKE